MKKKKPNKKQNPKIALMYDPKSGIDARRIIVKLFNAVNDHYKKFGSLSVGVLVVQVIMRLLDKLKENGHGPELDLIARHLVKMHKGEV